MIRSTSAAASGRPAPRYAPIGVVLVATIVHLEADVRDAVHALRHRARRSHRQRAAEPGVGAGVADHAAPHPDDRAVALEPELDVLHLAAPVRHRDQVLGARLDPSHGPAVQLARDRAGPRPRRDQCLAPNEPPTCGAITRRSLHVDAEEPGRRHPDHVRHLAREVDGELVPEPVVAGHHRDRGALHRDDGDALVLEAAAHHDVGAGERVGARRLAQPDARRCCSIASNSSGASGASASSMSVTTGSGS